MELQTCDCFLIILMGLSLSLQVRDVVHRFGVLQYVSFSKNGTMCMNYAWLTQESV